MQTRIVLSRDTDFTRAKEALKSLWGARQTSELHELEIRVYKSTRSLRSNNFYWAAVITPFAEHLGYTPEELHELLLAELYGIKVIEFRGIKREVPNKRTHDMKTDEFSKHIEHCMRLAAEQGVYIEPNERAA